jgi:hypothetical protein
VPFHVHESTFSCKFLIVVSIMMVCVGCQLNICMFAKQWKLTFKKKTFSFIYTNSVVSLNHCSELIISCLKNCSVLKQLGCFETTRKGPLERLSGSCMYSLRINDVITAIIVIIDSDVACAALMMMVCVVCTSSWWCVWCAPHHGGLCGVRAEEATIQSLCGNSILEKGEECDSGILEEGEMDLHPCCTKDCRLSNGTVCKYDRQVDSGHSDGRRKSRRMFVCKTEQSVLGLWGMTLKRKKKRSPEHT